MANRAVVWIELAGPGQRKVVAFVPENPEPRPQNVNDFDSWMTAKWRVHSAGGRDRLGIRTRSYRDRDNICRRAEPRARLIVVGAQRVESNHRHGDFQSPGQVRVHQ